jgi:hypothetical protein
MNKPTPKSKQSTSTSEAKKSMPKTKSTTQSKSASPVTPAIVATPQTNPQTQLQPVPITGVAVTGHKGSKLALAAAYSALVAGLLANYAPTDTFDIAGKSYTRDDLVTLFNSFIQALQTSKSNRQTWLSSVAAADQLEAEVTPLRTGVLAIVGASVGKTSTTMEQFGVRARKVGKPSAATQAAAVAKRTATRKAKKAAVAAVESSESESPQPPPAPAAQAEPAPAVSISQSNPSKSNGAS